MIFGLMTSARCNWADEVGLMLDDLMILGSMLLGLRESA